MNKMHIRAAKSMPCRNGVQIFIEDYIDNGHIATNLVMEEVDNPFAAIEPLLTIEDTQAQELMDDLWQCGFRPSEGTGSAGAFAAQSKHLEDMRKLVFECNINLSKEIKK